MMAEFFGDYAVSQNLAEADWDPSVPITYDGSVKCDICLSAVWSTNLGVFAPECQCDKKVPEKELPEVLGAIPYSLLGELSTREAWSEKALTTESELKANCERGTTDCACFHSGNFAHLPLEVILKIFSYFSQRDLGRQLAPVCHQFMLCAYDPIFWRKMVFETSIDARVLSTICARRGSLTTEIKIEKCDNFTGVHMDLIGRECSRLERLDLSQNPGLDFDVVRSISTHCVSNLVELDLSFQRLVDHNCLVLLSALKKLQKLNVAYCTRLLDDSIVTIAHNLNELVSLNIDGISWITDRAIEELARCRCQTLKSLDADGAELTSSSIRALSACSLLERLSLSFAELLCDDSLTSLKVLPNLKELRIRKGFDFSSNAILSFLSHPCTKNLTLLNLKECIQLTDDGVIAISKSCGPRLKILKLCWCWNVTDRGLEAIIDTCRELEVLDVLGLDQITGVCLANIPTKLPLLTTLNLSQCNQIKDEMIIQVLSLKPTLTVFNYYGENFLHEFD